VDRTCPAKGDQRELPRIVPALDRYDAKRRSHARVDDVRDPGRSLEHALSEGPSDLAVDRPARLFQVNGQVTTQQSDGVQIPEGEVRIGHGRATPALAVADGAGLGAGALRPHSQRPARVEPRDTAPTRAHLREVDDGHPDRMAGAVKPSADVSASPDL